MLATLKQSGLVLSWFYSRSKEAVVLRAGKAKSKRRLEGSNSGRVGAGAPSTHRTQTAETAHLSHLTHAAHAKLTHSGHLTRCADIPLRSLRSSNSGGSGIDWNGLTVLVVHDNVCGGLHGHSRRLHLRTRRRKRLTVLTRLVYATLILGRIGVQENPIVDGAQRGQLHGRSIGHHVSAGVGNSSVEHRYNRC